MKHSSWLLVYSNSPFLDSPQPSNDLLSFQTTNQRFYSIQQIFQLWT